MMLDPFRSNGGARAYVTAKAFEPGGKEDSSYEERLSCAAIELLESIENEICYVAEWWEVDAEELMGATCGEPRKVPQKAPSIISQKPLGPLERNLGTVQGPPYRCSSDPEDADPQGVHQAGCAVLFEVHCDIGTYADHYAVPHGVLREVVVDWLVCDQMGWKRTPAPLLLQEKKGRPSSPSEKRSNLNSLAGSRFQSGKKNSSQAESGHP